MEAALAKTPLYDWHVERNARVVDFAGWAMPVQYTSIVAEHLATRTAGGVFDISHMGRLKFAGPSAEKFLDRLLTRRVTGLAAGAVRYSLVTNEEGGILDDVLVYKMEDANGEHFHMLVVNASNREKMVAWFESHRSGAEQFEFKDETGETAMLAVKGPAAVANVDGGFNFDVAPMKYYSAISCKIGGCESIASRTGYTGEDGCELIVPSHIAVQVADQLLEAGQSLGLRPAGLGARDTLRLEAAMPLYGHELSEEINPYQAGLGFAVQLKDRQFVGSDALGQLQRKDDYPQRVGLELDGKRVPREGYEVRNAGEAVGIVTSGTYSPTLERPIAMAYVRRDAATVGTELVVDIRGRHHPARVAELPFYRRPTPT